MRNLNIKYSSIHEICKLLRVLDIQHFHTAWLVHLQFCRRAVFVCPSNQTATLEFLSSSNCVISFIFPLLLEIVRVQHIWDLFWTKWHCDRFCPHLFRFSLSVSFHQFYILIFMNVLLLPYWWTGETWDPSKMRGSFRDRRTLDTQMLLLILFVSTMVTGWAERRFVVGTTRLQRRPS